ncbi:hypothetical protein SARC_10126 [Sphaeroforma arctica JP610]|uniref:Peptidase S8/S53 domain-containing protein n=1 Tax=Sphaeroforma arctica JP610 TaxID=667725 RepID=A0A0L0FKU5_9EUKA|nr:hypothetical protein SARC_10126 [Sphaeroforma arctica JP610]KNC77412.1 hypothetical protein SARC_10126 [Sphaeroforma arctica JP610]|eukprot:XP_014151314.1 hypothetical protein SARC_10126 [Sphaeroforma arctica JP610]
MRFISACIISLLLLGETTAQPSPIKNTRSRMVHSSVEDTHVYIIKTAKQLARSLETPQQRIDTIAERVKYEVLLKLLTEGNISGRSNPEMVVTVSHTMPRLGFFMLRVDEKHFDVVDAICDYMLTDGDVEMCERDWPAELQSSRPIVRDASEWAKWGLDRIDQAEEVNKNTDPGTKDVLAVNGVGDGVRVYVCDTGIRYTHDEFSVKPGRKAVNAEYGFDTFGGDGFDNYGHGTQVASVVGGYAYGVAPLATLVSVKVMDDEGNGDWSNVIAGLEFVMEDCDGRNCLVSLSLAAGPLPADYPPTATERAIQDLYEANILSLVATGNNADEAWKYTPGRSEVALTVGGINEDDDLASQSNFGQGIDIYAPGYNIKSAWAGADTRLVTGAGM